MNCLKTISVERDFGKEKLLLISTLFSGAYFLIFYTLFRTFLPQTALIDHGPVVLVLAVAAIVPIHLVLHCIPLWLSGIRASCGIRKEQWPFFYYSFSDAISKQISLLSTLSPAILITCATLTAAVLFPEYIHYIALASALNAGLSVFDIMNARQIWMIPKQCLIEEHRDGFYILRPIRHEEAN